MQSGNRELFSDGLRAVTRLGLLGRLLELLFSPKKGGGQKKNAVGKKCCQFALNDKNRFSMRDLNIGKKCFAPLLCHSREKMA